LEALAASMQQFFAGWWQVLLVVFAYVAAMGLLEAWRPAERGQPWRLRLENLHYGVWAQGINLALTPWLAAFAVSVVRDAWPGLVQLTDATPAAARGAALVAYFVAADVFYYWAHRWQHESPLLWRTHRLHHSDTALNASTTLRTHWLEEPVKLLVITVPVHLLFEVPPAVTGLMGILVGAWLFLIHANVRIGFGRIGHWLLVSPQVHRIHHSRLPQHRDRNYALFFPFIDRVFGSWYEPRPDEYPPTGLTDGGRYDGVWRGLLSPFRAPAADALPAPVAAATPLRAE
jgi:sterol desaturase/sphingolipid hydroxylase (fatty acid hydroxylase superfamily)